jgi:hypothetical protein
MTFISKDLQRIVLSQSESNTADSVEMTRLVNDCPKSFYKWNDKNHWAGHDKRNKGLCCFWD